MTSQNGHVGPGAQDQPGGTQCSSGGPPGTPPARKLIPLQPGMARPTGERRVLMRDAVLQVVRHLVLETVPPGERSALFDQAAELLDLAGWGLDELFEASREGPARDELFRRLGLLET
jgi:hypothetical protein